MVWTRSPFSSLKSLGQHLTRTGKKKNINLFLSFSAVTNIINWMEKSALSNLVSLLRPNMLEFHSYLAEVEKKKAIKMTRSSFSIFTSHTNCRFTFLLNTRFFYWHFFTTPEFFGRVCSWKFCRVGRHSRTWKKKTATKAIKITLEERKKEFDRAGIYTTGQNLAEKMLCCFNFLASRKKIMEKKVPPLFRLFQIPGNLYFYPFLICA